MSQETQKYPIDRVLSPVQKFINQEKSGGIVLVISVILALIMANSSFSQQYLNFFEKDFGFSFNGKLYLHYSLYHWINDGLMAMFFFVVGLELKKEFIAGELASFQKAMLPVVTALGGMLMPALIYLLLNHSGEAQQGWGIPMATDIAFAMGVLYLLGNKVPSSLKVFLMALAVVDDLGSVLVIAFFYSSDISILNLSIGLGFSFIMLIANKLGVKNILFYAILGIGGVWVSFLLSGVHATIAAVLAAFMIPADSRNQHLYSPTTKQRVVANNSPLERLIHSLHPFVTFFVMPIFALANACISFADIDIHTLFSTHITIGVTLGLVCGKVLGVIGSLWIMAKLKLASYPEGMNHRRQLGLGLLASIGFTMSLFITSLAFTEELHLNQAKIGIFAASIIGSLSGYLLLRK
jgi:NhaA family Na+:H+ antiporter